MTDLLQTNPWLVGLPALILGLAAWFIVVACLWRDIVSWAMLARALVVAGLCWGLATLALHGVAMLTGQLPDMRSPGDWVSLTSVALSIAIATGFESALSSHRLRGALKAVLNACLAGRWTRRVVGFGLLATLASNGFTYYAARLQPEWLSLSVFEVLGLLDMLAMTCLCFGLFSGAARAWRNKPRTAWPLLSLALGAAIVATLFVYSGWIRSREADMIESVRHAASLSEARALDPSEEPLEQASELSRTFAGFLFVMTGELLEVVTEQGESVPYQPTDDEIETASAVAGFRAQRDIMPYIAALVAALGALAGAFWPRRILAPAETA